MDIFKSIIAAIEEPQLRDLLAKFVAHHVWWAVLLGAVVLLVASDAVVRVLRSRSGYETTVNRVELNDPDWRNVVVGTYAAQRFLDSEAHSGSSYNVIIQVGWRRASASITVQNIGDAIRLGDRMANKLGLQFAEGHTKAKFTTSFPYFRPDLWTFRHPNRDVRLQWQIGGFYFVMGALLPKLVSMFIPI